MVGYGFAVQVVTEIGQVVATVGHWVLADTHWVSFSGQVVTLAVAGHTVGALLQFVAFTGQVVWETGQAVAAWGKSVGLMT